MKLKLVINGCEAPDDYKLLRTTVSTVASLRKTAVLRFNSERLIIISTPKSASTSSGTILHGDTGQVWCTIPKDVFKLYTVASARELNNITMEYNCESLLSVFKRYDRVMGQGCSSNMTIKLQSMPEWNASTPNAADSKTKTNPVCALGISFEEIINTDTVTDTGPPSEHSPGLSTNGSKSILHSFKVPVRLLFKTQDAKIQEPMINYTNLIMYRLPAISGEFGSGFHNFIKRVERYTNVNHVKLSGTQRNIAKDTSRDEDVAQDNELKIIVNELDWHLEIRWNGPIDPILQPEDDHDKQRVPQEPSVETLAPESLRATSSINQKNITPQEENSMQVEDSDMIDLDSTNNLAEGDVILEDVSAVVQQAEKESSLIREVIIRTKDWKVCAKLYAAFEEVVLAISHDESCVFHCSLDRGTWEDSENNDQQKERGQIIYYMARSRGL